MRSFAGNFSPEELKAAVELCHGKGVRVHVTCNTMPRNEEAARLPEWLEYLDSLGVDAVILADMGVFSLAGKYAPHVERHISTQASVVNYQCARAWYDLGAKRVILARELSLDEIREIRAKAVPGRDPGDPGQDPQGAGAGGLCPRGHVRKLFRAVPPVQLHDGPGLQPWGLRPALPVPVCPHGGEAPRGVFPHF